MLGRFKILFFVWVLMQVSCSPIVQIPGKFQAVYGDGQSEIEFFGNGKMILSQRSLEIERACSGRWVWESSTKIRIVCDEELDLVHILSSVYIESPMDSIFIVGRRKITMGNIIFRMRE